MLPNLKHYQKVQSKLMELKKIACFEQINYVNSAKNTLKHRNNHEILRLRHCLSIFLVLTRFSANILSLRAEQCLVEAPTKRLDMKIDDTCIIRFYTNQYHFSY